MAAVIGVPAIRPEIAANASSISAMTASAQCIRAQERSLAPASYCMLRRRLNHADGMKSAIERASLS
jgi:hypothetical protein